MERFTATPPATLTRPTALRRSVATPPAILTRPAALPRSTAIQPAAGTRPAVLVRSISTQPAAWTSRWATTPGTFSPRVITILISATKVLQERPTPSASAHLRPPPMSPAFLWQALGETIYLLL